MTSKKVEIVVPVYNEIECLPEMMRRLEHLRQGLSPRMELGAIFVDDGSTDGSRDTLKSLARNLPWVQVVLLARNFGHQIAVTAGMDVSVGDYVAIIDGDLQDPPELIPAMIDQLEQCGDQIVFGQRIARSGESRFKLLTAKFFYKSIRRLSGLEIPLDTGDFRVMTRYAKDVLCSMRESNRFLRGLAPWTGLSASSFPYSREIRYAGSTKYNLRKMTVLASNAVVSFSTVPLRAIQVIGFSLVGVGIVGLGAVALTAILSEKGIAIALLISSNLLTTGTVTASVGIVGGYVHRIQDEVRERPLYIVEDSK